MTTQADPLLAVWGAQQTKKEEVETMAIEVLRGRGSALARKARVRKWSETVAGGASVVFFAWLATAVETRLLVAASALLALGELVVIAQMWARSTPGAEPEVGASTGEYLAYVRGELERERALLRTSWAWYLAPVAAGLVLLPIGMAVALGWNVGVVGAVWGASLVGVWAVVVAAHRWTARKLGREIAALGGPG